MHSASIVYPIRIADELVVRVEQQQPGDQDTEVRAGRRRWKAGSVAAAAAATAATLATLAATAAAQAASSSPGVRGLKNRPRDYSIPIFVAPRSNDAAENPFLRALRTAPEAMFSFLDMKDANAF